MPSEHQTGQYLEWCIDLPSIGGSRESPVFFLNGNEWIFGSEVEHSTFVDGWMFRVFVDLKNHHRDLEPCSVKCQVEFKKGKTSSFKNTVFEVSHHYRIWDISYYYVKEKLLSDHKDRDLIKFVFFFEGVTEPLLNLSKETVQIWSLAHLKVPTTDEPSDFGWVEIDNKYEFNWFSGSRLPLSILQITGEPGKDMDQWLKIGALKDKEDEDEDDSTPGNSTEKEIPPRKKRKSSSNLQLLGSNFCLENLSQDLGKMLHNGLDHDVEVKCDDHTWKVHKNVLSIRSKVLQSMLNSEMIEGRTRVITLKDMNVPTVQHFLDYLYSGKLPEMTVKTAKKLYEVGDKYAIECLRKMCSSYLVAYLTPENTFEILGFALQHSDFNFKENIIQFMIKRKVFMIHDLWTDFRQSNKEIAFEVYDRFFKSEFTK